MSKQGCEMQTRRMRGFQPGKHKKDFLIQGLSGAYGFSLILKVLEAKYLELGRLDIV